MKKAMSVVLLIIIVGIGYYLSLNPANSKGNTGKVVSKSKNTTVQKTTANNGTNEVDLSKVVWARDYFKKYIGKVDAKKLILLNDYYKVFSVEKIVNPFKTFDDMGPILKKLAEFQKQKDKSVAEVIYDLIMDDTFSKGQKISGMLFLWRVGEKEKALSAVNKYLDKVDYFDELNIRYCMQIASFYGDDGAEILLKHLSPEYQYFGNLMFYIGKTHSAKAIEPLINLYNSDNMEKTRKNLILKTLSELPEDSRIIDIFRNEFQSDYLKGVFNGNSLKLLAMHSPKTALPILKKYLLNYGEKNNLTPKDYINVLVASTYSFDDEVVEFLFSKIFSGNFNTQLDILTSWKIHCPERFMNEMLKRINKFPKRLIIDTLVIFSTNKYYECLPVLKQLVSSMEDIKANLKSNCIRILSNMEKESTKRGDNE